VVLPATPNALPLTNENFDETYMARRIDLKSLKKRRALI
jgi:hypothetical protein